MNTVLLVGGDLCARTARRLDPLQWRCLGLRRSAVAPAPQDPVTWFQGNLQDPESLAFLADAAFANISHVLYAPSPDSRTPDAYAAVYSQGLPRLLKPLLAHGPGRLQRCVLVGSTAVWGPSDAWVDEQTPVQDTNFRTRALLQAEEALTDLLPPGVGVTLRLSGLYGPGRQYLVNGLRAGKVVAPDGPGHWGNRIHMDDAASACAHLLTLDNPYPVYIGTDDQPLPLAEFYDEVAQRVGAPLPPREVRAPEGKRLSNKRLRASGWVPQWPKALDWYASEWSASEGSTGHR